ncbi:MAG: TSUP family transporter [Flavobacteriales bacterium]
MELYLITGYILSVLAGVILGLIGGGGSILTVPILVYILHISPELSTAYSLFIVGVTALVGSYMYFKKGELNVTAALVFSVPSLLAVFLTRKYLMPQIPESIFSIGNREVTKSIFIMLVFAVLMIAASISMIRSGKNKEVDKSEEKHVKFNYPLILIEGGVVGVLTGFVGAGGGFLIIPALVLFAGLSMKMAIGTSLLIIAAKSLIGFLGDVSAGTPIEWSFLLFITTFTIMGVFIGSALSVKISGNKLKPIFGWFVLVMGIFILIKETCCTEKPDTKSYLDKGDEITHLTFQTLSGALQNTMQADGFQATLAYCNTNAYPLTDSLAQLYGATIKRSAVKFRNSANEASSFEKEIIEHYLKEREQGKTLEPKVTFLPNGNVHYARPVLLLSSCQTCHGILGESVSLANYESIKSYYPNDLAIGFNETDLRGIWSVTFEK